MSTDFVPKVSWLRSQSLCGSFETKDIVECVSTAPIVIELRPCGTILCKTFQGDPKILFKTIS